MHFVTPREIGTVTEKAWDLGEPGRPLARQKFTGEGDTSFTDINLHSVSKGHAGLCPFSPAGIAPCSLSGPQLLPPAIQATASQVLVGKAKGTASRGRQETGQPAAGSKVCSPVFTIVFPRGY